jgi:hypothetical protein
MAVLKALKIEQCTKQKWIIVLNAIVVFFLLAFTLVDDNTVRHWSARILVLNRFSQQQALKQRTTSVIGQTESRQLEVFLENEAEICASLPNPNRTMTDLRAMFHINVRTEHCTHRFTLQDTRKRTGSIRGGANFRTIAIGVNHLIACPFVDHFNGTYDIVCETYDPVVDISITLMFLDYENFFINCKRLLTVLWTGRLVCSYSENSGSASFGDPGTTLYRNAGDLGSLLPRNLRNPESKLARNPGDPGYTGWYRSSAQEPWQWLIKNQPVLSECQCRQCLQRDTRHIVFIGDSHVRFAYLYTLSLAGHVFTDRFLAAILNPETTVGRITYIPAPFVSAKKKPMQNPTMTIRNKHRSVMSLLRAMKRWKTMSLGGAVTSHVIIGVGSWDATYRGVRSFVNGAIPAVVELLTQMRDEGILKTTRVLVLTLPAHNDHRAGPQCLRIHRERQGTMSSASAAAVNGILAQRLAGLDNVVLVDHLAVTVARSNETVDVNHFMNASPGDHYPENPPINVTMVGEIGKTFGRLLIGHICQDYHSLQCSEKA